MTEDGMVGWHHQLNGYAAAATAKSLQPCLTLCYPMDCTLPGSSVLGIFQARILRWAPFSSPGEFLTQGSNLGLLHWQADSLPLSLQGSPTVQVG